MALTSMFRRNSLRLPTVAQAGPGPVLEALLDLRAVFEVAPALEEVYLEHDRRAQTVQVHVRVQGLATAEEVRVVRQAIERLFIERGVLREPVDGYVWDQRQPTALIPPWAAKNRVWDRQPWRADPHFRQEWAAVATLIEHLSVSSLTRDHAQRRWSDSFDHQWRRVRDAVVQSEQNSDPSESLSTIWADDHAAIDQIVDVVRETCQAWSDDVPGADSVIHALPTLRALQEAQALIDLTTSLHRLGLCSTGEYKSQKMLAPIIDVGTSIKSSEARRVAGAWMKILSDHEVVSPHLKSPNACHGTWQARVETSGPAWALLQQEERDHPGTSVERCNQILRGRCVEELSKIVHLPPRHYRSLPMQRLGQALVDDLARLQNAGQPSSQLVDLQRAVLASRAAQRDVWLDVPAPSAERPGPKRRGFL